MRDDSLLTWISSAPQLGQEVRARAQRAPSRDLGETLVSSCESGWGRRDAKAARRSKFGQRGVRVTWWPGCLEGDCEAELLELSDETGVLAAGIGGGEVSARSADLTVPEQAR